MLWVDFDFDYSDELARKYMKYQGKYYDKGTKVKLKGRNGPVDATFVGWKYNNRRCFEPISGEMWTMHDTYDCQGVNKYVLEIIEPVYPNLQTVPVTKTNEREKPPSWDVEVAWIWYIAIMLLLTIFKARVFGWIVTTMIFFGWKNGFLNGGKK